MRRLRPYGEKIFVLGGYVGDKPSDVAEVYEPARLYAIGGRDDNAVSQAAVERYDPGTDTWETVAPPRTARGNPGVAVAGRRIFVVGGQGAGVPLRTTERYDPQADRWQELPPLLVVGRSSLSADHLTITGRKVLIAFGGFELVGTTPVASARVETLAVTDDVVH